MEVIAVLCLSVKFLNPHVIPSTRRTTLSYCTLPISVIDPWCLCPTHTFGETPTKVRVVVVADGGMLRGTGVRISGSPIWLPVVWYWAVRSLNGPFEEVLESSGTQGIVPIREGLRRSWSLVDTESQVHKDENRGSLMTHPYLVNISLFSSSRLRRCNICVCYSFVRLFLDGLECLYNVFFLFWYFTKVSKGWPQY